jgi:hypothetical protein
MRKMMYTLLSVYITDNSLISRTSEDKYDELTLLLDHVLELLCELVDEVAHAEEGAAGVLDDLKGFLDRRLPHRHDLLDLVITDNTTSTVSACLTWFRIHSKCVQYTG